MQVTSLCDDAYGRYLREAVRDVLNTTISLTFNAKETWANRSAGSSDRIRKFLECVSRRLQDVLKGSGVWREEYVFLMIVTKLVSAPNE